VTFTVYKVSSDRTSSTYYGYTNGDETTALEAFMVHAKYKIIPGKVRGASEWHQIENQEDEDSIVLEVVDACTDELEALESRNDQRSADQYSIVGPSFFPPLLGKKLKENSPELIEEWKRRHQIKKAPTARKAMILKGFDMHKVKMLGELHGKIMVVADLDKLTPNEFSVKYLMPLQLG
jgi:hypothetical protein